MAISRAFLDELKVRTSLKEVVGKRVKLVRKGRDHWGCCPFHGEKTPSFKVDASDEFYKCFGCGVHGSAIDFLVGTEGLSFPEAVAQLAGMAGMEVPQESPEEQRRAEVRQSLYDVLEKATVYFEKMLRMPEGKAALDYLHGRGLDDGAIKRHRLGFAPNNGSAMKTALAHEQIQEDQLVDAGLLIRPEDPGRSPYARFRGRVIFPITDRRGRMVGFGGRIMQGDGAKYLNSPETAVFHKGRNLYGLKRAMVGARKADTLIVTEGYMDVIALVEAGFDYAVAPLGTALTEEQIAELWRVVRDPILCFDGDEAGQRAALRAAERVLPILKPGFSLRFAVLPEGEDPDSLIKARGKSAMQEVLDKAMPLSEVLWKHESGGHAPKSPEDRASLQKRLEDHAKRIGDANLRAHFQKAFKDRVWQSGDGGLGAKAGKKRFERDLTATAPIDGRNIHSFKVNPLVQTERVLLALLINHPAFFEGVEEEIGAISFVDSELDNLRQAILVELSGKDVESPGEFKNILIDQGYGPHLKSVFGDVLVAGHRLIRPDASGEDVAAVWQDGMSTLRKAEVEREANEARLGNDFSEDDWLRKKAMLEAQIGIDKTAS